MSVFKELSPFSTNKPFLSPRALLVGSCGLEEEPASLLPQVATRGLGVRAGLGGAPEAGGPGTSPLLHRPALGHPHRPAAPVLFFSLMESRARCSSPTPLPPAARLLLEG